MGLIGATPMPVAAKSGIITGAVGHHVGSRFNAWAAISGVQPQGVGAASLPSCHILPVPRRSGILLHMSELTAADLQAITGASGDNLESWIARLSLSTAYEETVAGRARKFSKDNAMELGVIAALVKQGMKPAAAAEIAANLFEIMKTKKPKGFLTVLPGGNYTIDDKPPSAALLKYVSAVVVNVRQLEAEIDAYLDGVDDNDKG
jgi:hypothetical protein